MNETLYIAVWFLFWQTKKDPQRSQHVTLQKRLRRILRFFIWRNFRMKRSREYFLIGWAPRDREWSGFHIHEWPFRRDPTTRSVGNNKRSPCLMNHLQVTSPGMILQEYPQFQQPRTNLMTVKTQHETSNFPPTQTMEQDENCQNPSLKHHPTIVGGWSNPFENLLLKIDHFPKWGENFKQKLETTTDAFPKHQGAPETPLALVTCDL